jgi:hypothetical protein
MTTPDPDNRPPWPWRSPYVKGDPYCERYAPPGAGAFPSFTVEAFRSLYEEAHDSRPLWPWPNLPYVKGDPGCEVYRPWGARALLDAKRQGLQRLFPDWFHDLVRDVEEIQGYRPRPGPVPAMAEALRQAREPEPVRVMWSEPERRQGKSTRPVDVTNDQLRSFHEGYYGHPVTAVWVDEGEAVADLLGEAEVGVTYTAVDHGSSDGGAWVRWTMGDDSRVHVIDGGRGRFHVTRAGREKILDAAVRSVFGRYAAASGYTLREYLTSALRHPDRIAVEARHVGWEFTRLQCAPR